MSVYILTLISFVSISLFVISIFTTFKVKFLLTSIALLLFLPVVYLFEKYLSMNYVWTNFYHNADALGVWVGSIGTVITFSLLYKQSLEQTKINKKQLISLNLSNYLTHYELFEKNMIYLEELYHVKFNDKKIIYNSFYGKDNHIDFNYIANENFVTNSDLYKSLSKVSDCIENASRKEDAQPYYKLLLIKRKMAKDFFVEFQSDSHVYVGAISVGGFYEGINLNIEQLPFQVQNLITIYNYISDYFQCTVKIKGIRKELISKHDRYTIYNKASLDQNVTLFDPNNFIKNISYVICELYKLNAKKIPDLLGVINILDHVARGISNESEYLIFSKMDLNRYSAVLKKIKHKEYTFNETTIEFDEQLIEKMDEIKSVASN